MLGKGFCAVDEFDRVGDGRGGEGKARKGLVVRGRGGAGKG